MKKALLPTLALAVLAFAGCQSIPQAALSPGPSDVASWSHAVDRMRPPSVGCFTASFPSRAWSQIACSTPSNLHGQKIGSGYDYLAQASPHVISFAEGSFPSVAGLKSVRSNDSRPGWSGTNAYSLQLNSQDFPTSACGSIAHCAGWVQFVYQNPPGDRSGSLLIWDWLVSTTDQKLSGCPPHARWAFSGGFCYQVSQRSVVVPNQPISRLAEMSVAGMAASDGDSIIFGVGGTKYAVRNAQSDDIADLSTHWQGAEFNVFAPGDGATATFNAGTTITVGLELRDGTLSAPQCLANAGTTAESNDLSFVKLNESSQPSAYPSIRFSESNVRSTGRAACLPLAGSGNAAR